MKPAWMRPIILIAVVMTASFLGLPMAAAQKPADPVAKHRAAYERIVRKFARYRRASADMDSLGLARQSTDGGHLDAYCEGAVIRPLVAEYFGESGDATFRYYLDRDSLFFVLVESRRGTPDGSTPYPPRTIVERERFYFTSDRLVRWLGPRNEPWDVATSEARRRERELMSDVQRLRAVMAGCRPRYAPQ